MEKRQIGKTPGGDKPTPFAVRRMARLLVLVALVTYAMPGWSQSGRDSLGTSSKTVEVTRTFEPTVGASQKVVIPPELKDTVLTRPSFTYQLLTRPVWQQMSIRPVSAARVGVDALPPFTNGYILLGYGNYISPRFAAEYGRVYGPHRWLFGASHRSSWGTLKLFDGVKERASRSRTAITAAWEGVFKVAEMKVEASYRHDLDRYYGRDTIADTSINRWFGQVGQGHRIDLSYGIRSRGFDSASYRWYGDARGGGYVDNEQGSEWRLDLGGGASAIWRGGEYGLSGRFLYTGRRVAPLELDTLARGWNGTFLLTPWARWGDEQWRVQVGLGALWDGQGTGSRVRIYPDCHFSYQVHPTYLTPYLRLGGGIGEEDYSTLRQMNPWSHPGASVTHSFRQIEVALGLSGAIVEGFDYQVEGGFSLVDSLTLFVNRVLTVPVAGVGDVAALGSDFTTVRDNGHRWHAGLDLRYSLGSHLQIRGGGNYWGYNLSREARAWHLPSYRFTLGALYQLQRKLMLSLDFQLEGGRYARLADGRSWELPLSYILNLHAQYRFYAGWYAFLDVDNVIACRSDYFYRYRPQSFRATLGVIWDIRR